MIRQPITFSVLIFCVNTLHHFTNHYVLTIHLGTSGGVMISKAD